ncbi:hypothetical protein ACET3Z_012512 [Daucus carota]
MAGRHIPPHPHHRPDPLHVAEIAGLQRLKIQDLLVDNQRLAATHVALKQEVALSHQERRHLSAALSSVKQDSDAHVRELLEKAMQLEVEVRGVREREAEWARVREDLRKMEEDRRELVANLSELEAKKRQARGEVMEVERVHEEKEVTRREILKGRAALEYEKKMHAVNDEITQILDEKIRSMEREIPILMAEVANAKKMERAAAAVDAASPGSAYASGYGNSDVGYTNNSSGSYAAQQFQGNVGGGLQYRSQSAAPAHSQYGTQQYHAP